MAGKKPLTPEEKQAVIARISKEADAALHAGMTSEQRLVATRPAALGVRDIKDARGKGSPSKLAKVDRKTGDSAPVDAEAPVRPKHGKRRKGTPKSGQKTAPPVIAADGAPLDAKGQRRSPAPSVGGAKRDVRGMGTTEGTASRAAGPTDLESARRVHNSVVQVLSAGPYKIPRRVVLQRIGPIPTHTPTPGARVFDPHEGLSFLTQEQQFRQTNHRSIPMPHPWTR